jgi:cytochrome c-type biogenesis protein CcmH/NrfF
MKTLVKITLVLVLIVMAFAAVTLSASAQDDPRRPVSDDEVNAVSKKLYCPVCENITLDTCGTLACAQWRDEVRILLSEGNTPEQVIENFVVRFGDRVVGTPVDPLLRAIALVTPWLFSVAVLIGVAVVFFRWRNEGTHSAPKAAKRSTEKTPITTHSAEEYRARLEADLAARR